MSEFAPGSSGTKATPTFLQNNLKKQQNLVIILTDDLTISNPSLISVWAVFISYGSTPPSLNFVQIFPSESKDGRVDLMPAFSLTESKDPSPVFDKALRAFNFPIDGVIVTDAEGFNNISGWMFGNQYQLESPISATSDNQMGAAQMLQQFVSAACPKLTNADPTGKTAFSWQDLIPKHFHTRMPFETMAISWQNLSSNGTPPHCEFVQIP